MPFDLPSIGQLLRETREKRGLTIDDVSNALFIKNRFIGAIEAGDWNGLPHPVYVKGYVTQYAAFLNILDLFESERPSRENGLSVVPEDVGRRRKTILRGWKFRKKEAQAGHP